MYKQESIKYYTRQELADALGVSLSTVKRMLNSFNLKFKGLVINYMHPSLLYKLGSH